MRIRLTPAVVALVALGVAAEGAPGSESILTADDVPGFSQTGAGRKVALQAAGTGPRAFAQARARGARFAGNGRQLRVGVFTFKSRALAGRALRRAGHGLKRVKGVGGTARGRSRKSGKGRKRRVQAVVLVRVGRAIGAVRIDANGPRARRGGAAVRAYAKLLAGKVRRALSLTAYDRVLEGIGPDGSFSTRTAVEAFAIAYGRMPGVKLKKLGKPLGGPDSGTLPLLMVERVWGSLTPAQRAAVDSVVGGGAGAASASALAHKSDVLTPAPDYEAIAVEFMDYYKAHLPGPPVVTIKAFRGDTEHDNPNAPGELAFAHASPAQGYCEIVFSPHGQTTEGTTKFRFILAHEVFHCFQFALLPPGPDPAPWIMEGTASWAALQAYPAPFPDWGNRYVTYFEAPEKPLFSRTYDAVAFWGRVGEVGSAATLWNAMPAILSAPTNHMSFAAAGADLVPFVDTFASSTFRYPGAGGAWFQQQPAPVPYTQLPPPAAPVLFDDTLTSQAYGLSEYEVVPDPQAPLVHLVAGQGSLRAGDVSNDYGTVADQWFSSAPVTCPNGSSAGIPAHTEVAGNLALGLSGGSSPGSAGVSFHELSEFCQPGVVVSGETSMTFTDPAICSAENGQFGLSLKNSLGAMIFTIQGFGGAGQYELGGAPPGFVSVVQPTHKPDVWYQPESFTVNVLDPGTGRDAAGATGTINGLVSHPGIFDGVDPDPNPPTVVGVNGDWKCAELIPQNKNKSKKKKKKKT